MLTAATATAYTHSLLAEHGYVTDPASYIVEIEVIEGFGDNVHVRCVTACGTAIHMEVTVNDDGSLYGEY